MATFHGTAVSDPTTGAFTFTPDTVLPPPPPPTGLAIKRSGPLLVNGSGTAVQLRGVNVSGLENTAVQQWAKNADGTYNYWGDSGFGTPDFSKLLTWKCNVVRLPLNASSWLGLSCLKGDGTVFSADPATVHGYQQAVYKAVTAALAAGLYVILDLHWSAPKLTVNGLTGYLLPSGQAPFADTDTCLTFWQQVAAAYKNLPGVMFELFNEPYLDIYGGTPGAGDQWPLIRNGGTSGRFPNQTGKGVYDQYQNWGIAGFQQMTDAIRGAGATNLILVSGPNYAKKLSGWVANKVTDPLDNIAAVWHAYPTYGTAFGTPAYAVPNWAPDCYTWAEVVITAGYPVIVTETGGHNAAGTVGEPFLTNLLAWIDKTQASVLGWGWNIAGNQDNILIKDASGTPTDGAGQVFHDWMVKAR